MKWFKHDVDFLSSPQAQILIDRHGPAGGLALVRLYEILAKEFNVDEPGKYLFSRRKIFDVIFPSLCPKTGNKIFEYFRTGGWIEYKILGKEMTINCKEMKKLADEYTQKVLKERQKKEEKNVGI